MKTGISQVMLSAAIMVGVCAAGCGGDEADKAGSGESGQNATKGGDDHDHDDDHDDQDDDHDGEPKSLGEAVASLEAEFVKMQEAFADNDTDAADGPVHEVGHILEYVEELATEASLNEDQKTAVSSAVEELFMHFGKLDKQIHAGGDVGFADLEPKISTALTALKAAIQNEG